MGMGGALGALFLSNTIRPSTHNNYFSDHLVYPLPSSPPPSPPLLTSNKTVNYSLYTRPIRAGNNNSDWGGCVVVCLLYAPHTVP